MHPRNRAGAVSRGGGELRSEYRCRAKATVALFLAAGVSASIAAKLIEGYCLHGQRDKPHAEV